MINREILQEGFKQVRLPSPETIKCTVEVGEVPVVIPREELLNALLVAGFPFKLHDNGMISATFEFDECGKPGYIVTWDPEGRVWEEKFNGIRGVGSLTKRYYYDDEGRLITVEIT